MTRACVITLVSICLFAAVCTTLQASPQTSYAPRVERSNHDLRAGTVTLSDMPLPLTEEERAWLRDHPEIRFGVDTAFPPYEFVDDAGTHMGMTADYAALIEERLGIRLIRVPTENWSAVLDGLKERRLDLCFSLVPTAERRTYLGFTRPYTSYPTVVVTRTDKPFLAGLFELQGRRTAVVRNYYVHDYLLAHESGIELVPYSTVGEALRALERGDVYAYVGNLATTTYEIRSRGITDLRISARLAELPLDLAVGVRSDWPMLVGILNKAMDTMPQGARDQLFQKWISYAEQEGLSWSEFWRYAAWVLLAAVVVFGFLMWRHMLLRAHSERLAREVAERKQAEAEKEASILRLEEALASVKTLRGLIPICAQCKKIRDDSGYWNRLEEYIMTHSNAELSHGLCPTCQAEQQQEILRFFEKRDRENPPE